MKVAATIALLSLSGSAIAASPGSTSKCWRKCARQVGVTCGWSEVTCNCRAVNAGMYAAANQCYCNLCSEEASKVSYDWTAVALNAFNIACSLAFEPLDQQAIDKASSAATCDISGNSPSNYLNAFPGAYPSDEEDSYPPPRISSYRGSPKSSPPSPYYYDSTTVYEYLPTDSRDVTYSYATLTVPVTPVPVSTTTASGTGTNKSGASAGSKTGTSTKSSQQSKAAAVRREPGSVDVGVSVFALAAAVIFGF